MTQGESRSNRGEAEEQAVPGARQGRSADAVEIPERPAVAANVRLVGEMQESGFRDSQWLIQRGDRFVQASELLYRIVEQANGERTLEEIAAGVTEVTDWAVGADDVRQFLRTRLVPMGLIVAAGDEAVLEREEDRVRSPLAVNMRTKVFGPDVIDPVTGVLQVLFTPFLLLPLLGAITIAHGWLYFVHGVVRGIFEVLYTPGLLPAVLVVLLVAGVFHEFGHAAALRYGGGEVRGMGVGLYIVYPAMYTDVTDSYRLGRWARVRTDLGGFYFHLIFALGLIVLYLVTRQEFLLFVVLLINLNIVYQCLPFVRFDGYWALADLTGIPDFFSQMGAFLRSVLPIPRWKGAKLPNLKPWVKAVFSAYALVTIPILLLLAFFLVTRLPPILAALWDSFLNQTADLSAAWSTGDVSGVAASVLQMFMLSLQALAIIYLLQLLARKLTRIIWNWGKPTLLRRIVGALVLASVVVGVAFLWMPEFSFSGKATPPGVRSFEVAGRDHVRTSVSYPQTPPVGGNHAPVWQNCGFYETPITAEHAVHSLEHGAVWITYRPGLSKEQVDSIRQLAQRQDYVLASPYPGLSSPVAVSAWGRQLLLESAGDPRLDQFVLAFRLGQQAPERGESCTGGIGRPN